MQEEQDRANGIEPKPARQKRRKKTATSAAEGGEGDQTAASAMPATPAEAAKAMLMGTSKRSSKKINYAALDQLFDVDEELLEQKMQERRRARDESQAPY